MHVYIKDKGKFYEFVSFGKSNSFVCSVVINLMENYKLGNLICYFKDLLTFVPSISDIKKTNIKERGVKPMPAC